MPQGPETKLVNLMVKHIRATWPQAWVRKIYGGSYQTVGIPDLLVVIEGRLVALEVKKQRVHESEAYARGRVTPTQEANIAALRRAGAVAEVVLSVEEALDTIRSVLQPPA